ncbi:DUF305 domain-containing protein [Hymenobacter terrestris]|uniref:DUF305 domain-containing protein n=1 Tax=Hymenobacter terrestris TaxID=2748310 RepID=A0ABX2QAK4_9BACT|nr:DUF305 domain-containing protein [Hymenobacter terrestris]NVO86757.1 DUF305 domain-containing protein [Hymenobacter terrestris]
MKNLLRLPMLALALASVSLTVSSCNKDDSDSLEVQAHDQNAMMSIMHDMMKKMDAMPKTQDPDQDYSMMMVMHHQGAIDMSELELKDGQDPQMRDLATRIIAAQKAEIARFNAFLAGHKIETPLVPAFNARQKMAMEKMMRANDLRVITGNTDRDFAQLMQDHHQSAIETSQAILDLGRHSETKVLAQEIIDSQMMEIKEMQEWLLKNKGY